MSDAGLDALNVLEGVDEGMYSRVMLDVEVWTTTKMTTTTTTGDEDDEGGRNDEEDGEERRDVATEKEEGTVMSAFGYLAGPASFERGGGPSATCREIGDYSLEVHETEFVPKHKRRAGSLGTGGVKTNQPGGGGSLGAGELRCEGEPTPDVVERV